MPNPTSGDRGTRTDRGRGARRGQDGEGRGKCSRESKHESVRRVHGGGKDWMVLRQRTSKAQNSETYGMLVAAREVNSHRASD